MTAKKHPGGRPPTYKCKEEIVDKIEAYFKECEGEVLRNANDEPVLNKFGEPVYINQKPPTVTGLALALGFSTRMALLSYQGKEEFTDTILRAKARVEEYAEQRLYDRDGSNGAQFSLRNNFSGWNERQKNKLDEQEQKARIQQIKAQTAAIKAKTQSDDGETAADDGFLEALKGTALEDWVNEES